MSYDVTCFVFLCTTHIPFRARQTHSTIRVLMLNCVLSKHVAFVCPLNIDNLTVQ